MYTLSNAPSETLFEQLAQWQCQRYFVERTNQDAKSELGFDDFCAQKYTAWQHHLALTALAAWFVARTKWEWAQAYPQDATLAQTYASDYLPQLSMRNVRSMLRAIFPVEPLAAHQTEARILENLSGRARSRRSRCRRAAAPS